METEDRPQEVARRWPQVRRLLAIAVVILFLGLNMQDLTGDARSFLEEFSVTYPTIRDQGNDVAQSYGVTGVPETYFVSARGRVVGHVIGVVDPSQLASGANAALRGRIVGTASGGAQRPQR